MLDVGAVVPHSTTDFPGAPCAVVYLQGCPWKCVHCRNPALQARPAQGAVPWREVLQFLERRAGVLEAVVFSGGEPTLQAALPRAIDQVRALGYRAGLQTAGIYPRRLAEVLPRLDWVSLDIKARFGSYPRITRRRTGAAAARESLDLVVASGVSHEVRTIWHPGFYPFDHLAALAETLARKGVKRFSLQRFEGAAGDDPRLAPAADAALEEGTLARLRGMFESFTVLAPGAGRLA